MAEMEFELEWPLTEEQWDVLEDADLEHTENITFHTKHGKEVRFVKDMDVPSKSAERYPLPITCGECGHTMRPVHKHCTPDMPRTYFCTFCGAGFHDDDPRIRFREKRTNADRLRAMSDEELAKWLEVEFLKCPWCKEDAPVDPVTKECLVPHQFCWECTLDWLKSPAEVEK